MSLRHIYNDVLFSAVLLLITAHGVLNAYHPVYPGAGPDELGHLQSHLNVKNELKANLGAALHLKWISLRKPPLPYIFSALASFVFPHGYTTPLLVNVGWGFLWLILLYVLGRRIVGASASFAALCILTHPLLFWRLFSYFGNDMPACLLVTAALALLTNEQRFRGVVAWPILGLLVGLGLLAKPTVLLFTLPPAALVFALQIRAAMRDGNRRTVKLILIGGGLAVAVALAVWSMPFDRFFADLRNMSRDVRTESTVGATPFQTLDHKTIVGDWQRFLGWRYVALLALGTALAPLLMRGEGRRVWLAAYLPALLTFIRAPQSSAQYAFPVLIVPLWAAFRAAPAKGPRLLRDALFIAIGVAALLTPPMKSGNFPPPGDKMTRVSQQYLVVGQRLAAELNRGNGPRTTGDLLYINPCPEDDKIRFIFALLAPADSPRVDRVYVDMARHAEMSGNDYRQLIKRQDHIRYLLSSCGATRTIADFTAALNATRIRTSPRHAEPPAPVAWSRFAGVSPCEIIVPEEHKKQRWLFWMAKTMPTVETVGYIQPSRRDE